MSTPQSHDATDTRRARSPGTVFLACGLAFLAVGTGTHQAAFLALGPAFLAIGSALLARARRVARAPQHH